MGIRSKVIECNEIKDFIIDYTTAPEVTVVFRAHTWTIKTPWGKATAV